MDHLKVLDHALSIFPKSLGQLQHEVPDLSLYYNGVYQAMRRCQHIKNANESHAIRPKCDDVLESLKQRGL